MIRAQLLWKVGLALALVLSFGVGNAFAADYQLTSPNAAISAYPAPYGNVNVTLDATKTIATITLTNNVVGGFTYSFGDGSTIGLNVNGTVSSVGTPTGTPLNSNFGSGTFDIHNTTPTSSQQVDGFGKFNFTIDTSGGYDNAMSKLVFTITKSSGTWADDASVLFSDNDHNAVVAHVFVTDAATPSPAIAAVNTGYASEQSPPPHQPVPEPTSMILLGGLFAGLGVFGYRRARLMSAVV